MSANLVAQPSLFDVTPDSQRPGHSVVNVEHHGGTELPGGFDLYRCECGGLFGSAAIKRHLGEQVAATALHFTSDHGDQPDRFTSRAEAEAWVAAMERVGHLRAEWDGDVVTFRSTYSDAYEPVRLRLEQVPA